MPAEIDRREKEIAGKVVAWRRDIHEHPELGNREHAPRRSWPIICAVSASRFEQASRTPASWVSFEAACRARWLRSVRTWTRLPVTEQVSVPFASKVKATYNAQEVGVMHACGHDNHVAILMGVAEILAGMKDQLPGTVKFIFQPAEEGAPSGEEGGAA